MNARGRRTVLAALFILIPGVEGRPTHLNQRLPADVALKKATCGDRYSMLLAQIEAPNQIQKLGPCRDLGYRASRSKLPAGYHVYVYPHRYIWRDDRTKTPKLDRRWGSEQVLGKPNTDQAGDIPTAWASETPDAQDEWLILEYASPVVPAKVHVYETYNPGALSRVTAFKLNGEEVDIWRGRDPTSKEMAKGVSIVRARASFKTNRIKLYLSSRAVVGWNEIDAVGLESSSGEIQWAKAVQASSTYAEKDKK